MKNVFFIILSVFIFSCQNGGKPKEVTKTNAEEGYEKWSLSNAEADL